MKSKLDKAVKYSGSHKGIFYMISHHGFADWRQDGIWCYYIHVNEKQIPKEYRDDFILEPVFDDKDRLSHNYSSSALADFDWHCGITYYSKEGGADGEPVIIKMGCDYGHYWDEGHHYDENSLQYDAINSIEKMLKMYPDLMVRSSYYGGYFKSSEGEFNERGSFISFEEKERWAVEYPETVCKEA